MARTKNIPVHILVAAKTLHDLRENGIDINTWPQCERQADQLREWYKELYPVKTKKIPKRYLADVALSHLIPPVHFKPEE